ncbi:MAG: NAD(P)/FAD-dependent oxidoreductase [Nocardioidaceae bacterium]
MARVIVAGGGLAGCASAVRLAKLGHTVTLIERLPVLGGDLRPVERDGFVWDSGVSATTLPAALRDLFKKSGRPLARELDLVQLPALREHRFADGSRVVLPAQSRVALRAAIDDGLDAGPSTGLGTGLGQRFADWVDGFAEAWELVRSELLEHAYAPAHTSKRLTALLRDRRTLHRSLEALKDERLKAIGAHPFVAGGHDPRQIPWWLGFVHHVEQVFGAWTVSDGMGALATLLEKRLGERRVRVVTETPVLDIETQAGAVTGVRTAAGVEAADVVVCAVDPRTLPALAPLVARTRPASAPSRTYLGLSGDTPTLAHETVLHGDASLTITTGRSPDGQAAWTVSAHGLASDVLDALADHGLDVRDQVVCRIDRPGPAHGVLWQGRSTPSRQLLGRTPIAGLFTAGASATIHASLPFTALTSSVVCELVGPA